MSTLRWELSVFISRWRNRFFYLMKAPFVFKNWWALILPKLGTSVVLELRDGSRYFVRARTTDLAVLCEARIRDDYLGPGHVKLAPDSVVLDVGANIGDLTIQIAKSCPKGRVFAVEPVTDHMNSIRIQNILNAVDNVTCLHLALSNAEGQLEINVAGGQSSSYWASNKEGPIEKVRSTTLSTLMQEQGIEKLDLLKLDCEGAEWDIFMSSAELLPRIRQICMEFHCNKDWDQYRLADWLRERGYEVWHTGKSWNGILWAVRKS